MKQPVPLWHSRRTNTVIEEKFEHQTNIRVRKAAVLSQYTHRRVVSVATALLLCLQLGWKYLSQISPSAGWFVFIHYSSCETWITEDLRSVISLAYRETVVHRKLNVCHLLLTSFQTCVTLCVEKYFNDFLSIQWKATGSKTMLDPNEKIQIYLWESHSIWRWW